MEVSFRNSVKRFMPLFRLSAAFPSHHFSLADGPLTGVFALSSRTRGQARDPRGPFRLCPSA
jgi:hypothetical protein